MPKPKTPSKRPSIPDFPPTIYAQQDLYTSRFYESLADTEVPRDGSEDGVPVAVYTFNRIVRVGLRVVDE